MHVFLTGFMGVGKTTIGRELSHITELPFIDLDEYIEQYAKQSILDIFETEGEYGFRKIEREALLHLLNTTTNKTIIALGGGTMSAQTNCFDILQHGVCVYLQKDWKDIAYELIKLADRPLVEQNTESELKVLFEKREPFYKLSQLKMPINSTFTAKKLAQTLKLSTFR